MYMIANNSSGQLWHADIDLSGITIIFGAVDSLRMLRIMPYNKVITVTRRGSVDRYKHR